MTYFQAPKQIESLAEGFRVFTKQNDCDSLGEIPLDPIVPEDEPEHKICLHIQARTTRNEGILQAGGGVWWGENDPRNTSIRLATTQNQTLQCAEIVAALIGIQKAPSTATLEIVSSRDTLISTAVTNLQKWEDCGWIGVTDRKEKQALAVALRSRKGKTIFRGKHDEIINKMAQNEAARLAQQGAQKELPDEIDLKDPEGSLVRGAKLCTMTQAVAYAGIRERKTASARLTTEANTKLIQTSTHECYGFLPTTQQIWKSIRHKDFTRQIRNFLWKTIHGAHRTGKYWLHIPECEERARCQHCDEIETMEHILLKCSKPGQAEVWQLAQEMWQKKHPTWPVLSMGSILGCGLASIRDDKGHKLPGVTRLYRILVSESMYLIWKIRCDSVIGRGGESLSETEIHNRWISLMNERLTIDRLLTDKITYGKQASVPRLLVLQTWSKTLKNEDKIPDDWLREPEVLVGMEPKRSRRSPSPMPERRGRNR
ncbi:ribonuclease H-like protein [Mycena leptocephala]|nr:ribonuclease H-like protein [Mycena leptocephala]